METTKNHAGETLKDAKDAIMQVVARYRQGISKRPITQQVIDDYLVMASALATIDQVVGDE